MSESDQDPRWQEVSARWDEVGQRFKALGEQVRQQWDETAGDERLRENQRTIDDALAQIADAAGRVVSALGDSVKDPEPRREAGRAVSSLADAFAETVQSAVDEVRQRLRSRSGEAPDT